MSSTLSGLFVDHSDLNDMNQVADLNAFRTQGAKQSSAQTFWSTENRPASSPVQETLEIALASSRLVNWMQLDLARFPHSLAIEYFDEVTNAWLALLDPNQAPIVTAILHSVPTQLPSSQSVPGHLHPQHSFVGHWETLQIQCKPTYVQRLRLILQRINNNATPLNSFGQPADYSLAVRNYSLGYEVTGTGDVPRTLQSDDTAFTQPFSSTDDLLGSSVDFSLRQSSASRIVGNSDTDADTVWMCEPQPFPDAVVNFYVDLRDKNGNAQVSDQVLLNPVNNGSHITLYYSDDKPVGNFDATSVALDSTQVQQVPLSNVVLADQRLQFGQLGGTNALTIDNIASIGYDPSLPWWFGVVVRPGFNAGADANEHPILDCGTWRVSLLAEGFLLTLSSGDTFTLGLTYQGGQDTRLIIAYDGNTGIHMHAVNDSDEESLDGTIGQPMPSITAPIIALGCDLAEANYLDSDLLWMVLKEETSDGTDDFLIEPSSYCTIAQFQSDDLPQSRNALLRLDPTATTLVDDTHPWGLFGGPAAKYDQMTWSPVPRDYTMHRGIMRFSPVKASFWKLEITNLQPYYHDVFVPTPQVVQTFPPDVLAAYREQINSASPTPVLGPSTTASLGAAAPYSDFPANTSTGGTGLGYTNTETYVAEDYVSAGRLRNALGENWAYQTWHSTLSAPRFTSTQIHKYTKQLVTRTTKIAYRTGIRQLQFGRSAFSTQQDTDMYEDVFFDDQNITTQTNWQYDTDHDALTSGNATKAVATSLIFPSQRDVRGLQFSAQQSQPKQMLNDEEFQDPHYTNWTLVGDATVPASGLTSSPIFGSLLPIVRNLTLGFWGDIAPVYPLYGDLVTSDVTYGDLRTVDGRAQTEGGISSLPVAQPTGGRLYAAARVVADQDLSSPLWVQIVDNTGTTPQVLAEEQATVKREQVTEWYCAYTVGDGGQAEADTWGDVDGFNSGGAALAQSFTDSFHRADASVLGRMDSGQYWTDSAIAISSNEAVVADTSGPASTFDPGTPWGTYTITLGTLTTSPLFPIILLGSYVVMNDGTVRDTNTNHTVATLTLASNDVLSFNFTPTAQVPSGQLTSGVDPTVQSWSMIITQNSSFQTTVSSGRAFATTRGISGSNGQQFKAMSWVPAFIQIPRGTEIPTQPMPVDGFAGSDGSFWQSSTGRIYGVTPPVAATIFDSNVLDSWIIETGIDGSMSTGVVQVSTTVPDTYGTFAFDYDTLAPTVATNSYYVAILDKQGASQLYLRADGALVRVVGTTTTVLASSVVSSFTGVTSIKFAPTLQLSSAFRTAHGLSTSNAQTLIFMTNDVVVGVYSGNGLWGSGFRGLLSYNDGSGNYTHSTGFSWSPDANGVGVIGTGDTYLTWGQVDGLDTRLWGDLSTEAALNLDNIEVRVVQKQASTDTWYMDTLSLYADPIVWEFSNDGGHTWVPGFDIRNSPAGVVNFPPLNPNDALSVANRLCYRLTAWGPDAWVSHLAIRPWYAGFMQCVPTRPQATINGPNVNPWDQYAPIEKDPRWQVWSQPVPREWFFAFRNLDAQSFIQPYVTDNIVLSK